MKKLSCEALKMSIPPIMDDMYSILELLNNNKLTQDSKTKEDK